MTAAMYYPIYCILECLDLSTHRIRGPQHWALAGTFPITQKPTSELIWLSVGSLPTSRSHLFPRIAPNWDSLLYLCYSSLVLIESKDAIHMSNTNRETRSKAAVVLLAWSLCRHQ